MITVFMQRLAHCLFADRYLNAAAGLRYAAALNLFRRAAMDIFDENRLLSEPK